MRIRLRFFTLFRVRNSGTSSKWCEPATLANRQISTPPWWPYTARCEPPWLQGGTVIGSVADPAFYFDAASNPASKNDADPDPDPTHLKSDKWSIVYRDLHELTWSRRYFPRTPACPHTGRWQCSQLISDKLSTEKKSRLILFLILRPDYPLDQIKFSNYTVYKELHHKHVVHWSKVRWSGVKRAYGMSKFSVLWRGFTKAANLEAFKYYRYPF